MTGYTIGPEPRGTPDRRVELVVAGALAGLAGVASLGLALLGVLMDRVAAQPSPLAAWSGAALSAVMGVALLWLGSALARCRRWAVAVARPLAMVWLVTGAVGALLGVWLVPSFAGAGGLALLVTAIVVGAALIGAGVVLPGVLLWLLSRSGLTATCRRLDPGASWVDECPRPRLTLAVVWGLLGVSAIGMGAYGFVLPVGGTVAAGITGAVGWLVILLVAAFLAWATATGVRGWWGMSLATTVLVASLTSVSFGLVDPSSIAAHIPGETGAMLQTLASRTSRLTAVLVNLVAWATLLGVVLRAKQGRTGPGA